MQPNPPYLPAPGTSLDADQPPKVVAWARLYAFGFTLMYLLCVLGGAAMLVFGPARSHSSPDAFAAMIQPIIMIAVGFPLLLLSAIGAFGAGRRTKLMYWVEFALQALGCTSCLCLPAAIPLLIQWLKPEVKRWYNA